MTENDRNILINFFGQFDQAERSAVSDFKCSFHFNIVKNGGKCKEGISIIYKKNPN